MLGVVTLVTGAPGTGKTLGFVEYLCNDFLCRRGGKVLTNVRLKCDRIADYVSRRCDTFVNRHFGYSPSPDDVYNRLICFNEDDCRRLRNSNDVSSFFGDITNTLICIDEVHLYLQSGLSGLVLRNWGDFLAVLRHHHSKFVGLTQDISQVDRVLKSRVEARIEYLSVDSQRDPYFRIPLGDWSSLISALSGHTVRAVCSATYVRGMSGHWRVSNVTPKFLDERIFDLYDSYQIAGL